jgi:tetratricopeptide (TPR) repeat protein
MRTEDDTTLLMSHPQRVLAIVLFLSASVPAHAQAPPKFAFRAVHYDVTVSLTLTDQTLAARAKVELEAREASRQAEVELHPNLKISAVLGGDGKPLSFARDESSPLLLRVTLREPAAVGQKVTLTFEYAGSLANEENSPVKGVRLASVNQEGAYLLLPARWFPLTDYPADRFTAVFNVEVPGNFAVVGTGKAAAPSVVTRPAFTAGPGKATSRGPSEGRLLYTFRSERPVPAGTFVAGNIQLSPVKAEGLNISVYGRVADTAIATPYGESVARIVNFFSEQFGPLPEPNLTLAELPEGAVQGYAGPGLLLVNHRQWDPKVNYRLLAQLVAKQWWGNEVLPASPSDVWLSDGLARYCEALEVEQVAGKEGFNRALEDFAVGALTFEDAAPIAQASRLEPFTSEYRSVVVNKGAMVFHMLRAQLGDAAFHALLRDFYSRFAGKTARLDDFEKMAQERAKTTAGNPAPAAVNLTPFFAQWLNSTGVPEFKLDYIVYRTPKGFKIVGKVKQELETFRMPVEVKVETEGNPEYRTIEVIGSSSDFTIETFGRPKPGGLVLDPNNNLLKSSPKLRVRASIARGEGLAEQGRFYDAIQQYQRALEVQKNNSLANFRIGEAFFYQKNYQAAANAFREAVEGDLDPSYKWAEVWSHIYLGKIFDISGQRERAVNEYSKAKQTNDDTGGAQAEAERYLKQPYKEEAGGRPSSP